ncbi:Ku protein [Streptomyces sp. NBC_00005]|uniref:Ku protein n=1 Tax=Streptomyces sp. NBC_00005 TaxID=2903609 RepID=UPI003256406D
MPAAAPSPPPAPTPPRRPTPAGASPTALAATDRRRGSSAGGQRSVSNSGHNQIGEGYYLQPDGQVAAKPYKLLVQALSRSSKVAVAKYAWSGRERLGLLRILDNVIVLHAMRWLDEIRDPAELLPPPMEVSEEEIEGALALMESMSRDHLEGSEFEDAYTEAMAKIIEAKRGNRELPEAPEPEKPGKVLDLMAALTESVQKAKASRGDDADVHELPKKKTAAKKATKKQPAKKAAAKKTAAKKTTGRKPRSA